jgi:Ankyrin repeats (3 copies)
MNNRVTLLHVAAATDKPWFVPPLLSLGVAASIKCGDQHLAALHIACMHGHTECVRALLIGGADVHAVSSTGVVAAFIAALQGYAECLELLLEHAADLAVCDHAGRTLLHAAAAAGQVQCLVVLLSHCSDSSSSSSAFSIDAVTALGDTPLSLCVRSCAPELIFAVKSKESSDKAACAQLLLEAGARITAAVLAALVPAAAAAAQQQNDTDADEQGGPAAGARVISDYITSLRAAEHQTAAC